MVKNNANQRCSASNFNDKSCQSGHMSKKTLKVLTTLYPMSDTHSVFQVKGPSGWQPLNNNRVRKVLKSINMNFTEKYADKKSFF